VGIALGQAGVFRRVEPRVHAGQDREVPRRWERELGLGAERGRVLPVGPQYFITNGHLRVSFGQGWPVGLVTATPLDAAERTLTEISTVTIETWHTVAAARSVASNTNERLMVEAGQHHNSAICHIATTLLTRLIACWRAGQHHQLRDVNETPVTGDQARTIIAEQYAIPKNLPDAEPPPRTQVGPTKQAVAKGSVDRLAHYRRSPASPSARYRCTIVITHRRDTPYRRAT
jgi:hypothetical protein